MKKFGTKLVAVATATAMAFAFTPAVAFAADTTTQPAVGNTSGSGTMEGHAEKSVFCVVLPTVAESGNKTFDFILDPEGLIATTKTNTASKAEYADKSFKDGDNVYFENTTDKQASNDYSAISDKLSVINKSTMDVKVTVDATLKDYTGIKLTNTDTFSDDTSASLYLALLGSSSDTGKIDPATGKMSLSSTIAKTDDAYELKYNTDKYEYVLKSGKNDSDFEKYEFQMTGKCNSNGDWSNLTTVAPKVDVTWTVVDPAATPESDGSKAITITYTGDDPAAGSLTFTKPDGTTWAPPASAYDSNIQINAEADTITLTGSWITLAKSNFGTGTYKVVINGTTYSFIIK